MSVSSLRILIQTTTTATPDNWSVASLSLLREELERVRFRGQPALVTARNREGVPDPVLSKVDRSEFDELWLFALDSDGELTAEECAAVERFRQRGGGLVTVRDHQDMGISLCSLVGVGAANHFHTKNVESDSSRRQSDDRETPTISWPNYHSGRNGDFQKITVVEPAHPLLRDPENPARTLEFFPSHPHEGAVSASDANRSARVIAMGRSMATGRPFNLVVAFESSLDELGNRLGRAAAHSSFHHFADYNWDTRKGAPSFVTEPAGNGMATNLRAAADIRAYVRNLAIWLAPDEPGV
jgi:hypothetical protein